MRPTTRLACAMLAMMCVLSACGSTTESDGSARPRTGDELADQRFLVMTTPPLVKVEKPFDLGVAERIVSTLSPGDLERRQGAKRVRARELAYLTGSPEGRAFLAMAPQRVLVRGYPARACPFALARKAPSTTPIARVVSSALGECLDAARASDCGCQVVAAGSVLMVPQSEVPYATGIAVRVRARSLGLDGFLVAEDGPQGTTLLRDLSGPVGRIDRLDDGRVRLSFSHATEVFEGRARPVGYRRGRLAERIYAIAPSGARVSLLIGFDPVELASSAGGWLAWPPDA